MKKTLAAISLGALVSASLVIIAPPAAYAAGRTLYVPSRYHTISAAVAASRSGDTILVAPGTYRENISIIGKYVALKARSTNPGATTIIGRSGRTPVMIQHVPARSGVPRASITGFRIAGGRAPSGQGGAITVANHADPIIQRNRIEANRSLDGGGILVYNNSNPIITNNNIRNNVASTFGGGIFVAVLSSPRITHNLITGNRCIGANIKNGGPAGGGIFVINYPGHPTAARSHPLIAANTISHNSAEFAGGGIMLSSNNNTVISSNHIVGNRSSYGGGIHIENHGAMPTVSSNVIEANSAVRPAKYPGGGSGGGISVFGVSRGTIAHNYIHGNAAVYAGGGVIVAEGSDPVLDGNNVLANTVPSGISGAFGGGVGIAQATARMTNNVIRANVGPAGGGVAKLGTGRLDLINNVIVSNVATHGGDGAGGGVYVGGAANTVAVVNNIITANNDYQIFENSHVGPATYYNNIVTNTGRGMFFSFETNAIPGSNRQQFNGHPGIRAAASNLGTAPVFASNYSLQAGSPGIDDGRALGAPTIDMANHHRPLGNQVDIGAFER